MKIKKRNETLENLSFDKIVYRLKKLANDKTLGSLKTIDTDIIAQKVVSTIYDGVSSTELDEEAARIAISMTENLEFSKLASRLVISNTHKNTTECFSEVMEKLYGNVDTNNNAAPILADDIIALVRQYKDILNETIDYSRDYLFDYFGFKTLEKSYLMKINDKIVERPQHLYMRVAIQVHKDDIDNIIKTYHLISQHYFTFASPTMFNAGSRLQNLSSCFLIGTNDSIGGIYKTISDCAQISKVGGGIGVHINNIRSKGSVIRGTNGHSDGIIPMLKVYNSTCLYVNQCFTPDTWVYSKDGPKQMKDITTNDNLITIDGTFKKVNEVIKNNVNKEIMEIRATNTLFPVKVTKEHELYLLKNQKNITNYSVIKNRLEKGIIKPDFYNTSELTENDLVGFPIPKYELDNDMNDLDYYKFYGIMLGDGHICNERNEFGVTLDNETKSDLKDFIKKYLDKKNIHYQECNSETDCSNIRWSGHESLNLTRNMLYDLDNQKIIKQDFLHLPKNKIMKILEGLLRSDESNLKELAFNSASQTLIMQMRYLLLRIGVLTSGCVKDNITTKTLSYYLRIPKHPNLSSIFKFKDDCKYFKYFEWNGMLWGGIHSINKIQYEGEVYDFNMIDNHNYLTDMGLVHNSGKRKGSFAMYLSPEHPDIFEFLDLRKNQGSEEMRARDLFLAMWISDLFMKQVEEDGDWYLMDPDECPGLPDCYGEEYEELYWRYVEQGKYKKKVKAQAIWMKMLESQIETGTPYMLYKDKCNKMSNQKNIGTIKSSNLCVAPETMVLTSNGYYKIKELENQEVNIWNGQEFTKTTIQKTGENQELIKVKLSNGSELECTPYHKFYIAIEKKQTQYPVIKQIEARNLTKDMKLINSEYPIIKGGLSNFPYPYEHGLFSAGETLESELPVNLKPKFDVPINNNINIKLRWLEGLCDGNICKSDKLNGIQIASKHKNFLENIKYLLQTLGCDPKNVLVENKCQTSYRLLITSWDVVTLYKLGFSPRILEISRVYPKNNTKKWIRVNEIIKTNRIADTFCFKEEKRGMGIFNGILTGQCAEVLLYSDDKQYAVCNLASIALPKYVEIDTVTKLPFYNHEKLFEIAKNIVLPMNNVIDFNYYPVPETRKSNLAHRPIGVGIQGLSCTFIKMRYPFDSEEAKKLNKEISETIYFALLTGSMELAKKDGPYSTFKGSPMSEGKFQFDLHAEYNNIDLKDYISGRWDWETLRKDIMKFGIRNSTLTTCMPTASSAALMGNTESFEPFDSCIFKRRVLSGEYIVANKYLVKDLTELKLWNKDLKDQIIAYNGSIQEIDIIPDNIKELYRTVWEIKMKDFIQMSSERSPFICMTQSLNLFMASPTIKKLTSMHFYGWKAGLKTGIYYLRSKASSSASKFTIDPAMEKKIKEKQKKGKSLTKKEEAAVLMCSIENKEDCMMCTS